MNGLDRPGAREISNEIARQTGSEPNPYGASALLWVWGQFIDHDIDLTRDAAAPELAPIAIPAGDPAFDPAGTGTQAMMFASSVRALTLRGLRSMTYLRARTASSSLPVSE